MIRDLDNEYGRWNKLGMQIRGRNLTRTEFRNSAVGQTWLRAMEILSDNPEADQNTADAALGKKARIDNWSGQITNLSNALNIKDAEITRLEKEIESLKAQVGDNTKWETLKALIRELIGAK